jgi:hypothetical protein
VTLVGLPYVRSPVYRFPEPRAFHGPQFYNPYAGLEGHWRRANLHAHGRSWGGWTNGDQPNAEVVATYKRLGYDVAGVSNYHSVAAHQGIDTLPLYEHGYNITKRHQLGIGAHHVDWFDFPIWQGLSQQQFVIDRVARSADLVALPHPDTREAYDATNLAHLTGYHLIEVVNGPFESTFPWDAALSTGHPVWALGNDDTHDTTDARRTASAWTMIDAASTSPEDIVSALRAGRSYAVERRGDRHGQMDATLSSVTVDAGGTVSVAIAGAEAVIEFFGQDGAFRATHLGGHSAQYTFTPEDTYLRTVIRTPQTIIFLNPIFRTTREGLQPPVATVDPLSTWMLRLGVVTSLLLAVAVLWPVRLPARAIEPRPVAATNSVQEID